MDAMGEEAAAELADKILKGGHKMDGALKAALKDLDKMEQVIPFPDIGGGLMQYAVLIWLSWSVGPWWIGLGIWLTAMGINLAILISMRRRRKRMRKMAAKG